MPITKDDLLHALQQLTPDQVAGILSENHGRSPLRDRQLTDLTLKPSARDPRPTFYAETDGREFQPIRQLPYPKLLWHTETHQEITVVDEHDERARGPLWSATPPTMAPTSPEEMARKLYDSLTDEDKALIQEHNRQMRLDTVKRAMEGLSESELAAVMTMPRGKK